jgi:hypothetical protein
VRRRFVRVTRALQNLLSAFGIPPWKYKVRDRISVHCHADAWHYNRAGELLWSDHDMENLWHDEGEQHVLSACFATNYSGYGAPTANDYLGLDARSSLAEADTLASLSGESFTLGYARQALITSGTGAGGQDFVITQPVAAYRATTKICTFIASGGAWSEKKNVFLCSHATAVTSASGQRLYASLLLSTPRTLQDGDSLQTSMYLEISEP